MQQQTALAVGNGDAARDHVLIRHFSAPSGTSSGGTEYMTGARGGGAPAIPYAAIGLAVVKLEFDLFQIERAQQPKGVNPP